MVIPILDLFRSTFYPILWHITFQILLMINHEFLSSFHVDGIPHVTPFSEKHAIFYDLLTYCCFPKVLHFLTKLISLMISFLDSLSLEILLLNKALASFFSFFFFNSTIECLDETSLSNAQLFIHFAIIWITFVFLPCSCTFNDGN